MSTTVERREEVAWGRFIYLFELSMNCRFIKCYGINLIQLNTENINKIWSELCLITNVLVVISQYINYSQIYISWGKRIFQCWRKSFLVIIVNLSVKQPKWCKILLCNTQRKLVRSIDCSIMKITYIFVRINNVLQKIDKIVQCWLSIFNKVIW